MYIFNRGNITRQDEYEFMRGKIKPYSFYVEGTTIHMVRKHVQCIYRSKISQGCN